MNKIADIRKNYRMQSLSETDLLPHAIRQFDRWWQEAIDSKIEEVNAMTLATADANGFPSARIVLLKGYREDGFVFFTNYESKKGNDLMQNPKACLVFFWKELERQVRISGNVEKISDWESDEYFKSRPVESQIGAWTSDQSKIIESRAMLENRFLSLQQQFSNAPIPRPTHWGGYLVKPAEIEFWQGRPGRLHDRILYTITDNEWSHVRLSP